MTYKATPCPCGDPICKSWHVAPVAAIQGVRFSEAQARAVATLLNGMVSVYKPLSPSENPHSNRTAAPTGDHPSHKTRSSDSSLYDEVCVYCGATDGRGDHSLKRPCPRAPVADDIGECEKDLLIDMSTEPYPDLKLSWGAWMTAALGGLKGAGYIVRQGTPNGIHYTLTEKGRERAKAICLERSYKSGEPGNVNDARESAMTCDCALTPPCVHNP